MFSAHSTSAVKASFLDTAPQNGLLFDGGEKEALQLAMDVTLVSSVKKLVMGLRVDLHATALCLAPLAWLDSAAFPMFKMSNALLHSPHFAYPRSWSLSSHALYLSK